MFMIMIYLMWASKNDFLFFYLALNVLLFNSLNVFLPSHASECKAGHSGWGAGAYVYRLPARWIRLPKEWRGDAERRGLRQPGGAGGRHAGEAPRHEPIRFCHCCHFIAVSPSPPSPGIRRVRDHARWPVAGAQLRHVPVPRAGPGVPPEGHADARGGRVLAPLRVFHAARHTGRLARGKGANSSRQRNLPGHRQANEGCG